MKTEQENPWDDFPPGGFHASSDLVSVMKDIAITGSKTEELRRRIEADIAHEEQQFIRKVPVRVPPEY